MSEYEYNPGDVQQVIGSTPAWIQRQGIIILFLIFLGLIAFISFYKYSDHIYAEVYITTKSPLIKVHPKIEGIVQQVLVKDSQSVKKDETLAVIKSNADWKTVLRLEDSIHKFLYTKKIPKIPNPYQTPLKLGLIQESFSNFMILYTDYELFQANNFFDEESAYLRNRLSILSELSSSFARYKQFASRELYISRKEYNRHLTLYKTQYISESALEKVERDTLGLTKEIESLNSDIINNRLQQSQIGIDLVRLKKAYVREREQKWLLLLNSMKELLNEIDIWRENYLITAEASGIVYLSSTLEKNNEVLPKSPAFIIIPHSSDTNYIAKSYIHNQSAGKVEEGQESIIRLDEYPYLEFGQINATLINKSFLPDENGYLIEFDSLKSNNEKVKVLPGMKGQAKIILENRSLLHRVVDKLFSLLQD